MDPHDLTFDVDDHAAHPEREDTQERDVVGWQLHGPRGAEEVDVHGPLNVNEVGVMHQLALLGTGIALLPITFARRDERAGRLVRLFPRLSARGGAVYLVYPASSHVPRRVAALRDHLYAELRPYFSGEG